MFSRSYVTMESRVLMNLTFFYYFTIKIILLSLSWGQVQKIEILTYLNFQNTKKYSNVIIKTQIFFS